MNETDTQELPKKQQQLLAAAEELFFRHGIKRVTIEEICQKARVSKMTFYKYFPDKIALAQHIWRSFIQEALAKLDEIDAMELSFAGKLEHILVYTEELAAKMENEFVNDFVALGLDHLDQDYLMQRMLQFFVNAQQRGEVRPDIRPEFLLAIHDKTHELMHDEKLFKLYPDYAAYTRECFNLILYGILTRPDGEKR